MIYSLQKMWYVILRHFECASQPKKPTSNEENGFLNIFKCLMKAVNYKNLQFHFIKFTTRISTSLNILNHILFSLLYSQFINNSDIFLTISKLSTFPGNLLATNRFELFDAGSSERITSTFREHVNFFQPHDFLTLPKRPRIKKLRTKLVRPTATFP